MKSLQHRLLAPVLAGGLFLGFLAIYIRTAAPSVLSGDSAEFQFAAPLLGVPHPTTYPLYMLLGKLATLAIPFGDLAWRVTLVSAIGAALAVALAFVLARRAAYSTPAATIGALALGFTPGLWNAATMTEVYGVLMLLLAGLAYLLVASWPHSLEPRRTLLIPSHVRQGDTRHGAIASSPRLVGHDWDDVLIPQPLEEWPTPWRRLRLAAFVGGLGFTHHGLFVIAGLPLLGMFVLWRLAQKQAAPPDRLPSTLAQIAVLALCFAAGLLPWLYPLAQYARYGPFDGRDYGLPRHYFWGAPMSWGDVLGLLTGGPLRQGIFRIPTPAAAIAVLRLVAGRMLFEFGPIGVVLGMFGCVALLRRAPAIWAGTAWMFCATLAYLLLLGPAVQDAPVFTIPMLLPWALWIAAGVGFALARQEDWKTKRQGDEEQVHLLVCLSPYLNLGALFAKRRAIFAITLLVVATLAWGYTRVPYSSKRQLWLFRRFGEATLAQLPPNAAVITHWEQGMTLQYFILAEHQRPDVWVDVVEPSDEAWGDRARRYAGRPVLFVGSAADVAGLPVELARADAYADLFALQR